MTDQNNKLETIQIRPDSYECSITTDVALFGFHKGSLKILLTKRTVGDFKDQWLLPGGVMEKGETLEQSAENVLFCLTGIKNVHIEQVRTYGDPERHPVKRVVTTSFYALVRPENHPVERKMNVTEIKWFSLNNLPKKTGFDHARIIKDAHNLLKQNLKNKFLFGELLSETFTLNELQNLYESILEEHLDRRNFRKKILQMNILENTELIKKGVKGGPYLYKKRTS